MKTAQLNVKRLALADVKEHPQNPRRHTEPGSPQWESLRKSIDHSYFDPLVVNRRNGMLVSGHFRRKVMMASGIKKADCVIVDYSDEEHLARLMAANRHAGEDDDAAVEALLRSIDGKVDPDITGISQEELADLLAEPEPPKELLLDAPDELPGAHALKVDMAFPSTEIFGIPMLRSDMLAECPENITTWAGADVTEKSDFYFYNISTDSVRGLDFSKTIIGFYTDDARFEASWTHADLFTTKLLNRNPMAVLSPNFSLWFEMPEAVKIYNTYRARWVGRYFQEAGLKVIPDVNFSDPTSLKYCLAGIPKNAPCVAIQLQTQATRTGEEGIRLTRDVTRQALEYLAPKSVLCYHGDGHEKLTKDLFPSGLKVIFIMNRSYKRFQKMRKAKSNARSGGDSK